MATDWERKMSPNLLQFQNRELDSYHAEFAHINKQFVEFIKILKAFSNKNSYVKFGIKNRNYDYIVVRIPTKTVFKHCP